MSQTRNDEKIVSTVRYSVNMHMLENAQKLLRHGIDIDVPKINARTFVSEVIVIDGPECFRPIMTRSFAVFM